MVDIFTDASVRAHLYVRLGITHGPCAATSNLSTRSSTRVQQIPSWWTLAVALLAANTSPHFAQPESGLLYSLARLAPLSLRRLRTCQAPYPDPPFTIMGLADMPRACALQWWNIGAPSPELDELKTAKYTGTYADLNIYITMMQDNLLGCAQLLPLSSLLIAALPPRDVLQLPYHQSHPSVIAL